MGKNLASAALLAVLGLSLLPASADPLRTVVYRYESDARLNGGAASGSAAGQIAVAVVQATADGGLVVDVTQTVDRTDRPMQTIRCAIYGRTLDVICDQNVGSTFQETALLQYLGRFFYDPAVVQHGTWHASPQIKNGEKVDNQFTITKADGDLLTLSLARREQGVGFINKTDGTVLYNTAFELPVSIRLASSTDGRHGLDDINMSFSLLTDSMAKAASENSH